MPRIAVVDDGDVDLDFFLNDGGELAHSHLEAAIAHHDPDFRVGSREFRANRRRQREAHGAESTGGNQCTRQIVVVILRLPHLMLAHVGDHDRLALGDLPKIVNHVCGIKMAAVGKRLDVAHRRIALQFLDVGKPRAVIALVKVWKQIGQRFPSVADDGCVYLDVFVDFRAIDLDVNLAWRFCA